MPHSDVPALLELLRAKLVVMFAAYFDESGTDAGSAVTSVAGYVFEADQCARFDSEWNEALSEYGIEVFHMADCAHGTGEFKKLTKSRRDDLARRCIGIIKRRIRIGIATSVLKTEFDSVANLRQCSDPYMLCLFWCVAGVSAWYEEQKCTDKLSYFFEAGHNMQKRADKALASYHEHPEASRYDGYLSHSFIGKKDAAAVQAADLLAWEWRAEMQNCTVKRRPRRRSLEVLAQAPHIYCHLSADHIHALANHATEHPDIRRFNELDSKRSLLVVKKELLEDCGV